MRHQSLKSHRQGVGYQSVSFVAPDGSDDLPGALLGKGEDSDDHGLHARLDRSGLVGRTLHATFDSFRPTLPGQVEVLEACQQFAETADFDGGGGLWLIGPVGTGKTHLGAAMVNHVVRHRNAWAAIHSSRQIVRMLRAPWGGVASSAGEEAVIERLGSLALLVIDDVGVSMGSEAERVQLLDVVDRRYVLKRPTVVLSCLVPVDIKREVGVLAYDRLREGAKALKCNWPSHRQGAIE